MPIDSILVSVAVVAMFVVFAGVLMWGSHQTGAARSDSAAGAYQASKLLIDVLPFGGGISPVA